MTISKIVKFCLTKMAILFPCAGAQEHLGSEKRHLSVEWTQNPEISRKRLLICPVEAGAPQLVAQEQTRVTVLGPLPLFAGCSQHQPVGTWRGPVQKPIAKGSAAIFSARLPLSCPPHTCLTDGALVRMALPFVNPFLGNLFLFRCHFITPSQQCSQQ